MVARGGVAAGGKMGDLSWFFGILGWGEVWELELLFDLVAVEVVFPGAGDSVGGDLALGDPSGDGVGRDVEEFG